MLITPASHAASLLPPAKHWSAINDTVMGGVSRSRFQPLEGAGSEFSGILSLENNGGFASVRSPLSLSPPSNRARLHLTVCGDGHRYQLRFRTEERFDGIAYAARFDTRTETCSEHEFTLEDFAPTWRGRRVVDAPALTWEDIAQIGFMISDQQAGAFSLKVIDLSWREQP